MSLDNPWTGPPFGDNPADQKAIDDGYTYYMQNRERFDIDRCQPLHPHLDRPPAALGKH